MIKISGRFKVTGMVKVVAFTGWETVNVLWNTADVNWESWD